MIRRLALCLHPFEIVAYGAALVAGVLLRWAGLRMGWRSVEAVLRPTLAHLPASLAFGLLLHAAVLLLRWRSPRPWLRAIATPASGLLWLRIYFATTAMTYTYSWVKISVPLLRHEVLDPALWQLDRWLHFGVAPSIFVAELVAGTPVARWLDELYALWLMSVAATHAYVRLMPRLDLRRHFTFACVSLWIVGAGIYVALPAIGPCYAFPEVFEATRAETPKSAGAQERLWQNYSLLVAGRDGSLKRFNPFYGVGALPSLHVGAHVLFALWARRYLPRMFLPFAVAAALTFLGSLATGWHYAVDGYLGALLAWGALRLADRFEPVDAAAAETASASASPAKTP